MRGVCSRRSYITQLFIDICAWFQSYHFRAVPDQKFIWRNEWFPSPAEHTPSQLLQLSTQTMRWLQPNRPIEPSVPTLMGCTVNGNNGEMKSFQFNYYYCCELRMIDVNCDGNGITMPALMSKSTQRVLFVFASHHRPTPLPFRFRFDFCHNRLWLFRFCVPKTTTSTTIKVFQFMNVQQFRPTPGQVWAKTSELTEQKRTQRILTESFLLQIHVTR